MQNNNALIAIAAAATALAAAATALVSGSQSTTCATPAPSTEDTPADKATEAFYTVETTPAPAKRRGRPPVAAATPTPEAPAEPAVEEKEETKAESAATGMTLEELQKLIKPLIEEGQGAAVKQVINKYAPKLADMDAKDHAAFAKDIQALSM